MSLNRNRENSLAAPLPQRIIVTGAAGFIGYHLCRALLQNGAQILGLDNLNDYYAVSLKTARLQNLRQLNGFAFQQIDIADYHAVAAAFRSHQAEAVVHLAAQAGVRYSLDNPRAYVSSNMDGFLSILEAARHHRLTHMIYGSSSSVYGLNAHVPFSEHHGADHPVSLYAASKRANELMAHAYAHLYAIPLSGLRFFTVYGPWGRPDMAYFRFTKAIFEGAPFDVYDEAVMRRDFTYIDDIVAAIVRLIPKPPGPDPSFDPARPDPAISSSPYRIFNIGNSNPVRLGDFIAILENLIGKKAVKRALPRQPGDVEATFADVADLARVADFCPATPLEVGLAQFVAWYRDYYKITDAP
jgi:UDP-glucuronate 4-epimerase